MSKVVNGGWLSGKKTYVVAFTGFISAIGLYLTGDASLVETVQTVIVSLSAAGLRAGIAKT